MAHDVFLSYSSKDQAIAEQVRDILESQGIPCWMASREIIPGHPDWAAAITQAIQSSKALVYFHSVNSNNSEQVLNEIHTADANHVNIITFKLDQTHFSPGLEYFLARRQIMDASTQNLEAQAGKLAKSIPVLIAGDVLLTNRTLRPNDAKLEPPAEGDCPYKGLNYFDESDSALFFGREHLVAKLVGHLRDNHFLAVVVGSSGSGKSSIVRAGMIPALRSGKTLIDKTDPPKGCTQWPIYILTPGIHPLDSLAIALTNDIASVSVAETLVQDFYNTPRALHLFVKKTNKNSNNESLIIIDQFEELFTSCQNADERKAFIDNLITASSVESGGLVRVVITLRADFYPYCSDFENLREAVSKHQEFIGPMSQAELRRAIEEPAHQGNWQLESGLVDLLLREVGNEPGALPLLSHALLETWQRREGRWLTVRGYMESGGVKGAIARTAESVYSSLSTIEQNQARRLFLSLTELGEGTQDTRRRISIDEILSINESRETLNALIKKLTDSRLITTTESTIEVAHEALIREWPRLRDWLNEDRTRLRVLRRLSVAAKDWMQMNKDESMLYRGSRLTEILEINHDYVNEFTELENSFLAASILFTQQETQKRELQQQKELETEKRNAARLRSRNRVISVIGVLALLASVFAVGFGIFASSQKTVAEKQTTTAISNELAAISANAPFDLSVLMSKEAININDSIESEGALLSSLTKNPNIIQYLRGHYNSVTSVAISPDGRILASSSTDGSLIFWDVETRKMIHEIPYAFFVYGSKIAFSPNGKTLITGSTNGTLILWDVSTQQQIGDIFTGDQYPIYSVAFSPDGKYVASGDSQGNISFWSIETHKQIGDVIFDHESTVFSISYSPTGNLLTAGFGDGKIIIWDTATNEKVGTDLIGHTDQVLSVEFSPDGKTIASGSSDKSIIIWDVESQKPEGIPLVGHTNGVSEVKFSPDGKTLASGSFDNSVILWDVATHSRKGQSLIGHGSSITTLAFSSDGKTLASGDQKGTIILWTSEPLAQIGTKEEVSFQTTVLSPDENTVAAANSSHIYFFPTNNDGSNDVQEINNQDYVTDLYFTSDGSKLFSLSDNGITTWDAKNHSQLSKVEISKTYFGSAYSQKKNILATGDSNGVITLWDGNTLQKIGEPLLEHSGEIYTMSFNPEGTILVTAGADNQVAFWDVDTKTKMGTNIYRMGTPFYVAFSPDGTLLAISESDNTISIWDVATHEKIGESLVGHSDQVYKMVFSPDGRIIASGAENGEIFLWNVSTHRQIGSVLQGHTSFVISLIFFDNGKRLISSSINETISWDLDVDNWKQIACKISNRNLEYSASVGFHPNEDYELICPNLEANAYSLQQVTGIAHDAILAGDNETAKKMYQIMLDQVKDIDNPYILNILCFYGTTDGFAKEVHEICEKEIVEAKKQNSKYVKLYEASLGLNLGVLGENQAAIENLQDFVDATKEYGIYEHYGPKREAWIKVLQEGKNPFTQEVLQNLRTE